MKTCLSKKLPSSMTCFLSGLLDIGRHFLNLKITKAILTRLY
ncbi:LOW QUALITY PROTEIN: hypothetical protein TorRG33x02_042330 [Trema orientale]|uniref:Uncharacterized protein n=1 Tax=Trema orientale TaxID=63057 RepID=A0A2P5FQL7_TREOI|nr:LOW QUALITY PROTEIN: hypothetical protein TorRG33x02_042330 [Trema orientale]